MHYSDKQINRIKLFNRLKHVCTDTQKVAFICFYCSTIYYVVVVCEKKIRHLISRLTCYVFRVSYVLVL